MEETTISLATSPVSRATAACQVPEPKGANRGARRAAHEAQDRGLLAGHHAEGPALKAERLEEPEQHTHGQNQGTRLHQEALYLLPHVEGDIFEGGQAVGGQLQHEGGGLSLENQLLEEDAEPMAKSRPSR